MFWEDGIVKLPAMWQRAVEQNGDDAVWSRCWGKMKSVPVIASQDKKPKNLSAQPLVGYVFHLSVSAAISWSMLGMTPYPRSAGKVVDSSGISMDFDSSVI